MFWASLVAQWLRICLQGTQVQALVRVASLVAEHGL